MQRPFFAILLALQLLLASKGICEDLSENFFRDMLIVDYWNRRINERLPVTYNHFLQGGYLNMPSARMGCEGEMGLGFAYVPPYHTYNLRVQLIDRLEVTGNYRVFRGVDDPILTPMGFGDLSDKGANFKLSLFSPEDSNYDLPGIAIGYDDIMGTRNFKSMYVVMTQVLLDYDMEFSLGYGWHRLRGFFGGISWFPFRRCPWEYLKGLSIVAEYDATPYKDPQIEKHPHGRIKKSPINMGIKYRLWDCLDLSLGYIRGNAVAFSISGYYNMGFTKGILPKFDDPLPYHSPINTEPIGPRRSEETMALDLLYAMRQQGLDLLEATLSVDDCCNRIVRVRLVNLRYMDEPVLRCRLDHIFAALIPCDIDFVIAVIEAENFPVQEYHYNMEFVRRYADRMMGPHELHVLTPMTEVTWPCPCTTRYLFKQRRDLWNMELYPKTYTFFGSSRGKFKYALGLNLGINGYLFDEVYYSLRFGYIFFRNLETVKGVDRLNPSQLLNVRTDIVEYFKQRSPTVDEAYLQKNWNLGKGWYSRVALGYFEEMYGGLASELLYYPLNQCWAIGIEGAILRRRTPTGLGFTNWIRKYEGFVPTRHRFHGSQYFLDLYYNWPEANLDFKIMIGKFLANDKGARYEVSRYFPSGLRVTLWYTGTNGHDKINGRRYYDKGVAFSMPLDIFYTYSDRSRWGYGMSAWLRDVGAISETGMRLYETIREQRVKK